MKTVGNILYGLRWIWYIFQSVRYRQYRFFVFLSRPFAPHVLSSLCFVAVMFSHYLSSGIPDLSQDMSLQQNAESLFYWLQYSEGKHWQKLFDVPLLCVGLFCQIPQIVFRRYVAIRGSMKKPLRPFRETKPPKQKNKIVVNAKRISNSAIRVKNSELYEMPEAVQALLKLSV